MPIPKNLKDALPSLDKLNKISPSLPSLDNIPKSLPQDNYVDEDYDEESLQEISDIDLENESLDDYYEEDIIIEENTDPHEEENINTDIFNNNIEEDPIRDIEDHDIPEEDEYSSYDSYLNINDNDEMSNNVKKKTDFKEVFLQHKKTILITVGVILTIMILWTLIPRLFSPKNKESPVTNKTTELSIQADKIYIKDGALNVNVSSSKKTQLSYLTVYSEYKSGKVLICDVFDIPLEEGKNKDIELACETTFDPDESIELNGIVEWGLNKGDKNE